MTDNYANYPRSITEIKSDLSNKSTDWTARDACIDLLRQIDEGVKIHNMIICYTAGETQGEHYRAYSGKQGNRRELLGLMSRIAHMLNRATDDE